MPSMVFRQRAISIIRNAMHQFSEASGTKHPGLQGEIRELSAKGIFAPFLPDDYRVKTRGKIIDCYGKESGEVDLIFYSKRKLPPVMFESEEFFFPVESVFLAIEVKSQVTATEIKSAHQKAKDILERIGYSPGFFTNGAKPIKHKVVKVISGLFAFSSDLKDGGKSEFERYKEILSPGEEMHLRTICVVGKGYWYRDNSGWNFVQPTSEFDEVISFVSGILHSLHASDESRGFPRIGMYLMSETQAKRIE